MKFPDIVKDHEDDVSAWQADHPGKRPPDSYSRESALIELVRELELYMEHKPECNLDPQDFTSKCTCGLQALLDRLEGG